MDVVEGVRCDDVRVNVDVYNRKPRPRALLEYLDDEVAGRVEKLFPTALRPKGEQVYEDEFDVRVTGGYAWRAGHLHTVAFLSGERPNGLSLSCGEVAGADGRYSRVRAEFGTKTTLSAELTVPVRGELGALVRTHLVPFVSAMRAKPTLDFHGETDGSPRVVESGLVPADWCTPFLTAGDGSVLAGSFRRKGGGICWVLPRNCPVPEAWVAAALKDFRQHDPERVPALPTWWEQPAWATLEQRRARAAVADLEEHRATVVREFDLQILDAREKVTVADAAAANGAGRLLTADGDSLASAVQAALGSLGFDVKDMDKVHPEGDRREDLRVTDQDEPGWEAIVEVKGYTRGASVNDLSRIVRWAMKYLKETGREPDAQWHVVNAFRGLDPAVRDRALPNDADLHDFTADGGLLIDTRQLFQAQRDAEDGELDLRALRAQMRASTGRWSYQATN